MAVRIRRMASSDSFTGGLDLLSGHRVFNQPEGALQLQADAEQLVHDRGGEGRGHAIPLGQQGEASAEFLGVSALAIVPGQLGEPAQAAGTSHRGVIVTLVQNRLPPWRTRQPSSRT